MRSEPSKRKVVPPPIGVNEINSNYPEQSKLMWKKDDENFMGEDYEPEFGYDESY